MKKLFSLFLSILMALGCLYTAPAVTAQAAEGKKLIAITYDDGPGAYTEKLLDGLKARGVKATFFMLGTTAANYPDTVARVYREGHQVANHSYSHPQLTSLSYNGVVNEIQSTNALLNKACGEGTSYLVRPPYGSSNSTVASAVGAPLLFWSVDTLDWMYRNTETVKNNILNDSFDGAIVLLHDIHSTSVSGSLAAIDILKERGYEFVTVNELFRRRGKALENGSRYSQCNPNGTDLGGISAPVITTEPEGDKLRVTITAQEGAPIYYSTDGSELNQQSKKYTEPFLVSTPCTIKAAAAFNMNGSRSDTVTETITMPTAEQPKITIENGAATITTSTPNAEIYYSIDEAEAELYTEPIALDPGTVISAYAAAEGYLQSGVERLTYSHLGNVFHDVFPDKWYYSDIDRAVSEGLMLGMGNDLFYPRNSVTRGQLVTFLYRYSGETVSEEAISALPFTDVPEGEYYRDAVAWAYSNKIVDGYADNTYKPTKNITREEMSKIFYGYLAYRGLTLLDGKETALQYTDHGDIADWAFEPVGVMTECGLLKGDTKAAFNPKATSTRAEAATILMRLSDLESDSAYLPASEESTKAAESESEKDEEEPKEKSDESSPKEDSPTENLSSEDKEKETTTSLWSLFAEALSRFFRQIAVA